MDKLTARWREDIKRVKGYPKPNQRMTVRCDDLASLLDWLERLDLECKDLTNRLGLAELEIKKLTKIHSS